MRYIALLRGINVGGKNKVAMSELRTCFESLGFTEVSTYINSGNVLFSSGKKDESMLVKQCAIAIEKQFGFTVVVVIISVKAFHNALDNAPPWWAAGNSKEFRNDALFVIPPTTSQEALVEITKKVSKVDRLTAYGQVIFWTLPMADYNKSVVPKMIGTPVYKRLTMRSSTTAKKLYELTRAQE